MTTLGNDPGFINAANGSPEYDAADLRLLDSVDLLSDGSALGSRAGVRPSAVEGLEPSVSGGTYTVSPGLAVISKDVDGALGAYRVALSQAVVELVPAADSVNARKDVIYLRVFDTDVDGLGLREGQVVYEEGTPSATPVEPAVPADALFLASVDVPAAGQGNPTLQDRRVYTVASGGILPTSVRPSNPYVGQMIYRRDTDEVEVYRANGWARYVDAATHDAAIAWKDYSIAGTGGVAFRAGYTARYQKIGNTIHGHIKATVDYAIDANAQITIPLPVDALGYDIDTSIGTGMLHNPGSNRMPLIVGAHDPYSLNFWMDFSNNANLTATNGNMSGDEIISANFTYECV